MNQFQPIPPLNTNYVKSVRHISSQANSSRTASDASPIAYRPPLSARYQSSTEEIRPYRGLDGPSYTLSGETSTFNIPKLSLSGSRAISSVLDNWPSTTNRSRGVTNRFPTISSSLSKQHPSTSIDDSTKPKLLKQLEKYLDEELSVLGNKDSSNLAVLQIYRECFIIFINNFITYKPFLQLILNAYDSMLDNYRNKIQFIVPLKSKLGSIKKDTDKQLNEQKEQYMQQIMKLKTKINELQHKCDEFKLNAPSLKLMQKEYEGLLSDQKKKYNDLKVYIYLFIYIYLQERNQSLFQALDRAENDICRYRNELNECNTQIKNIPNLQHTITTLSEQVENNLKEKLKHQENLDNLIIMQKRVLELETELNTVKEERNILRNQLVGKDDEINNCNERYKQLMNNMSSIISQRERLLDDEKHLEDIWKAELKDLNVLTDEGGSVMTLEYLGDLMVKTIRNLKEEK